MLIYHVRRTVLSFPLARTSFERSKSGWIFIAVIAADSLSAKVRRAGTRSWDAPPLQPGKLPPRCENLEWKAVPSFNAADAEAEGAFQKAADNVKEQREAWLTTWAPRAQCPSSDNLRLIRLFAKGGSGSSGVRV
jgi:hypothetical protein